MADEPTNPEDGAEGGPPEPTALPVAIEDEVRRSFLDYSMSVIISRALPDVRDGLKPVHRRILWGMFDQGFRPDRNFVKCARVSGDVAARFHPHGTSAIYDALARMAHQATDEERRAVADHLLVNDSSLEALADQVDDLWRELVR